MGELITFSSMICNFCDTPKNLDDYDVDDEDAGDHEAGDHDDVDDDDDGYSCGQIAGLGFLTELLP